MKKLLKVLEPILAIALPFIMNLIESKVVPAIKRKAYEKINTKTNVLINDLAQNAAKIAEEESEIKKAAYIEGTRLGVETLRALAEKLNKAADEIEKVL